MIFAAAAMLRAEPVAAATVFASYMMLRYDDAIDYAVIDAITAIAAFRRRFRRYVVFVRRCHICFRHACRRF